MSEWLEPPEPELTWTNKHLALLAYEGDGYEWVSSTDRRVSEVRLLRDAGTVGETASDENRARDNLLIRGDALHALTSLTKLPEFAAEYRGKVKLAYIDPPFNTGQAFEQYDDNLEHSVWLTMMRDRLLQIKELLAPDGSVWLHLDDREGHRGKSLLEEVFGEDAFIATIVWERVQGARGDTAISAAHDFIHVFAPAGKRWTEVRNLLTRTEKQLSRYRNPDADPRGRWLQGADGTAKSGSDEYRWPITLPSGRVVTPPEGNYWRFTKARFERARAEGRVYFGRDGDSMPVIKTYLSSVQEGVVPRTWWSSQEAGSNQEAKRDHLRRMFPGVVPFDTPKPERLLQRILHIATDPGDVVLDCFVGSGTTAAVAMKMGRRWVASEWNEDTLATFAIPRVSMVVRGEDLGGITEKTVVVPSDRLPDGVAEGDGRKAASTLKKYMDSNALEDVDEVTVRTMARLLRKADKSSKSVERIWDGGSGFRVLDVAPSMFVEEDGVIYLADWASQEALAEPVAAQLGFELDPQPPFAGRKGRTLLAVVDGLVSGGVAAPPGGTSPGCGMRPRQ